MTEECTQILKTYQLQCRFSIKTLKYSFHADFSSKKIFFILNKYHSKFFIELFYFLTTTYFISTLTSSQYFIDLATTISLLIYALDLATQRPTHARALLNSGKSVSKVS